MFKAHQDIKDICEWHNVEQKQKKQKMENVLNCIEHWLIGNIKRNTDTKIELILHVDNVSECNRKQQFNDGRNTKCKCANIVCILYVWWCAGVDMKNNVSVLWNYLMHLFQNS